MGSVAVTMPVSGSTCDRVPSRPFDTQTLPAPIATPTGPLPTRIPVVVPLPVWTRVRRPSLIDTTQAPSSSAATAVGPSPTFTLATRFRREPDRSASRCRRRSWSTQTSVAVAATALGLLPTGIRATIRPFDGSIRATSASLLSTTHRLPSPNAIAGGVAADVDRVDGSLRLGVDLRDAAALGVGDPDEPAARGDATRCAIHGKRSRHRSRGRARASGDRFPASASTLGVRPQQRDRHDDERDHDSDHQLRHVRRVR